MKIAVFLLLAGAALASPEMAERHLRVGLKLLQQGRLRDARAELQTALVLAPGRADILEALARAERGGEPPKPTADAAPPATAASTSPSASSASDKEKIARDLEEARRTYRESDLTRAREAWQRALQMDQKNEEAKQGLARLEQEVYRPDKDAPFDSSVRELYEAALREARKDRLVEARQKLREALTLNPAQVQVKAMLSQIEAGAFAQAGDREAEARLAEAARALEAGELVAARRLYEEVLRKSPGEGRAKEGLRRIREKAEAEVESLVGRASKLSGEEALAFYQKALDLDPSHPDALRGVERWTAQRQRDRRSIAFKDSVKKIYNRGVEAWQAGDLAAAAAHFREVLELSPNDQDAARALKLVEKKLSQSADRSQVEAEELLKEAKDLEHQGRLQEALQAYERAAARDKQNEEARQGVQRLREEISGP